MQTPPSGREKTLEEINRLLAEATDDDSRRDLERLRDSLNSPAMIDMARALEKSPPPPDKELVLDFHAPAFPMALTATGSVLFAAVCLYAATLAWDNPVVLFGGQSLNLWLVTACAGTLSVFFTALSFRRSFVVRFDNEGMACASSGKRWQHLRAGAMRWKDIRSLQERGHDRVLEIRGAEGAMLEVPLKLVNYRILRAHLDNMVMLFGERA